MQELARLEDELFQARTASERTAIISQSLRTLNSKTAAWIIYFLSGKKLKKIASTDDLIQLFKDKINAPDWLWETSLKACGDALEALALQIGRQQSIDHDPNFDEIGLNLTEWSDVEINWLLAASERLSAASLRLLFQLATGRALFSGLEEELTAAIQHVFRIPPNQAVEWLFQPWKPHEIEPHLAENPAESNGHSVSFARILPFDSTNLDKLLLSDYLYERYLTGKRIRLELDVFRSATCLTQRMPLPLQAIKPLAELAELLPYSSELEGILEVYRNGEPVPESKILTSILKGSKSIHYKLILYDVLKLENISLACLPLNQRKKVLTKLKSDFILPENCYIVQGQDPNSRENLGRILLGQANQLINGIILKHKQSTYDDAHSPWLHVPLPERNLRAVLIYVEVITSTERRAQLTFGLPEQDQFMPLVALDIQFDPASWKDLVNFLRSNKIDKFGPVVQVKAERAYEIKYSSIKINKRKKAGLELADASLNNPVDIYPVETAKTLAELKLEWLIA